MQSLQLCARTCPLQGQWAWGPREDLGPRGNDSWPTAMEEGGLKQVTGGHRGHSVHFLAG